MGLHHLPLGLSFGRSGVRLRGSLGEEGLLHAPRGSLGHGGFLTSPVGFSQALALYYCQTVVWEAVKELVNKPSSGKSAACPRDMTETGRSAREIGRVELSGSELSPMPDRIALAIDFLTPRATSCFCRSDLARAGAFLDGKLV